LALGEFSKDESDAARQQQSCWSGHLLLDLPGQRIGANADPLLTVQ
jgi:hypothetical protein